ncbi:MAG: type IV secretion system protein [Gammaproteobacteria bacterium]
MNKKHWLIFLICINTLCNKCYADAIYSILNSTRHLEAISMAINNDQSGILRSQLDIEGLMKQVSNHMAGNSGWGTYQFHDYQSYGAGAHTWGDVQRMVKNGGGGSQLGQAINAISNQFPSNNALFNKGITDPRTQTYYSLQSQTILAARAASQVDYDKVQDQIGYQQMLQQQIEKTKDLKAAVDLNNRIQVEANLISLEVLRQSAIANQQRAVTEQAGMNNALLNAKFLTKR